MISNYKSGFLKIIFIMVLLFLAIWFVKYLFSHKTAPQVLPAVIVQKPQSIQMTNFVTQTGTTVAYNSVNLVARIKGYLQTVEFTDGTFVEKGKELFVIEPQPYLEKVKEAEASLAVQKASYDYAKAEYARQQRMYKQNATSLNNVEKWSARTIQIKAEIDKATANVAVASINYSYTHVQAPFEGRIGRHLVDPGNLVGNGEATNLAVIQQIDPIYVYFNLNEIDLIKIRDAIRTHTLNPPQLKQISAYVKMQNETKFAHEGKLNFVNTGLNASTGTMEFRAVLPNKEHILLPGLFVQVRIPITQPTTYLTIPDTAIQYDQIGSYVLVVNQQHYVLRKRIVMGAAEQGLRAITQGLNADDDVIISGLQNAIPGQQVMPKQLENK